MTREQERAAIEALNSFADAYPPSNEPAEPTEPEATYPDNPYRDYAGRWRDYLTPDDTDGGASCQHGNDINEPCESCAYIAAADDDPEEEETEENPYPADSQAGALWNAKHRVSPSVTYWSDTEEEN